MKTIYDYKSTIPFSLHDMRICKIETADESIKLYFEDGFMELKEPYKQVEGHIIIEGADFDFCYIHLLSKNGQYGNFHILYGKYYICYIMLTIYLQKTIY